MKPSLFFRLGALFLLWTTAETQCHFACAEWNVWTIQETRHVLRGAPPRDSRAVQLSAARNEWESFQILLRSDTPLRIVRIETDALRGPNGALLPPSETRLYREHQLRLETGTYRNAEFKPDWYPDPLIPLVEPLSGKPLTGARFQALPFDLPPGETHGFWIDLHVPADAPPGVYQGTYALVLANGKKAEIPVTLTVWGFSLPEVPSLMTSFGSPAQRLRGYERDQKRVEPRPIDWARVEIQCAQLLSENNINATPPQNLRPVLQPDGSYRIPSNEVRALRGFVDQYHLNAIQIPHPSVAIKDPDQEKDKLRAWLKAFDTAARELNRSNVIFYTYLKDEPNTLDDYRYVQKWGRAIRQAHSVVKVLVVEQTWTEPGKGGADSAWGDLYGAVDIWCPLFSLHRPESAAKREALGEMVWTYTALCQGQPTPWWHIDYPLLNYRAPATIGWRSRIRGLLYWGGMSYWKTVDDPWTEAPFYVGNGVPQQGKKGIRFNGEGSLVYPARAIGYDGIVPTIRLKALRDGIEDYEYLAILERAGRADAADRVIKPIAESFFKWDKDPQAWAKARGQLAKLILETQPVPPTSATVPTQNPQPATGPLRVSTANPRYFTDGAGRAVFLTGAHTWNNFQDMGPADPPTPFDYEAYLDFLESHHHNFIRLWRWELLRWNTQANREQKPQILFASPHPWARTGPGLALDGNPKFDLHHFNEDYFKRLRSRVAAAGERGIYVSIMLFEGWGMQFVPDAWRTHPFHPANSINGFHADSDHDGRALEIYTLTNQEVTVVQEAYVRKVIDTVNDLDNVLYEISNENPPLSTHWQYHFIRFIHDYERTKSKQHPVGMTFQYRAGQNQTLFDSPADWISPNPDAPSDFSYRTNPPPADGRKVILTDTDHLWGIGGDPDWVWKSFLRGLNPLFMDPYDNNVLSRGSEAQWERVRQTLGQARSWADKINLAAMVPKRGLASSHYCLAEPGHEYLVYLPKGREVSVEISDLAKPLMSEWFNPGSGATEAGDRVAADGSHTFKAPFDGPALLYLH